MEERGAGGAKRRLVLSKEGGGDVVDERKRSVWLCTERRVLLNVRTEGELLEM